MAIYIPGSREGKIKINARRSENFLEFLQNRLLSALIRKNAHLTSLKDVIQLVCFFLAKSNRGGVQKVCPQTAR